MESRSRSFLVAFQNVFGFSAFGCHIVANYVAVVVVVVVVRNVSVNQSDTITKVVLLTIQKSIYSMCGPCVCMCKWVRVNSERSFHFPICPYPTDYTTVIAVAVSIKWEKMQEILHKKPTKKKTVSFRKGTMCNCIARTQRLLHNQSYKHIRISRRRTLPPIKN